MSTEDDVDGEAQLVDLPPGVVDVSGVQTELLGSVIDLGGNEFQVSYYSPLLNYQGVTPLWCYGIAVPFYIILHTCIMNEGCIDVNLQRKRTLM